MDPETLFGLALGLTPPWQVRRIELSMETARLDISRDCPRGATFRCPACGVAEAKAYDTAEAAAWRHLNFFHSRPTSMPVRLASSARAPVGSKPWRSPGPDLTAAVPGSVKP